MTVSYTTGALDYGNVQLGNNTRLFNTTDGGDIDGDVIKFSGTGAIATFNGTNSASEYTLKYIETPKDSLNTVVFNNAKVILADNTFKPTPSKLGITSFVFNDAVVDLHYDNIAPEGENPGTVYYKNYFFSKMASNDSLYSLDIDLNANKADTLEIATVADGEYDNIITLFDLNFVNVDQHNEGKIKILANKLDNVTLAIDSDYTSDSYWQYEIDSSRIVTDDEDNKYLQIKVTDFLGEKSIQLVNFADDQSTNYDSIKIYNSLVYDILQQINQTQTPAGVVSRQFVFTNTYQTYTMIEELGTTRSGNFEIVGIKANDGTLSVIDADGYSMFDISNNAQMSVENVEFKNATIINSQDSASVFYLTNDNATLELKNVKFTDNQGFALYNKGQSVTMRNVEFAQASGEGESILENKIANYTIYCA